MNRKLNLSSTVASVFALGLLLPLPIEAARAPVGRHYMVLEVERSSTPPTMAINRTCLSFDKDEVCNEEGFCGGFAVNERWRGGNRWMGLVEDEDLGDDFELILQGYTETNGKSSSIGGTLIITGDGVSNGGFVGLQASRAKCFEFAVGPPPPTGPGPGPGPEPTCTPARKCCKICRTSKACGDSCISRTKTCRVGRGCACNVPDICPAAVATDFAGFFE